MLLMLRLHMSLDRRRDLLMRLRRIAVIMASVVAGGASSVVVGSPAQASGYRCINHGNQQICSEVGGDRSRSYSRSEFSVLTSTATAATGCRLTTWLTYTNLETGGSWNGPKRGASCTDQLPSHGGTGTRLLVLGIPSGTTAAYAYGHTCIDWYYNGSDHSGAQKCMTSHTIDL
jgi:hypothetical protein